jgi:hypothetical protein
MRPRVRAGEGEAAAGGVVELAQPLADADGFAGLAGEEKLVELVHDEQAVAAGKVVGNLVPHDHDAVVALRDVHGLAHDPDELEQGAAMAGAAEINRAAVRLEFLVFLLDGGLADSFLPPHDRHRLEGARLVEDGEHPLGERGHDKVRVVDLLGEVGLGAGEFLDGGVDLGVILAAEDAGEDGGAHAALAGEHGE